MNADGPQKLGEARNYIIFSLIAITIMLSVWGIATMLKNTFFEGSATPPGSPGSTNSLPATGGAGYGCRADFECTDPAYPHCSGVSGGGGGSCSE